MTWSEALSECRSLGFQYMKYRDFGHRGTQVYLYKVSESGFEYVREYEEIPAVEHELQDILREEGFKVDVIHHSCFEERNWCEVRSSNPPRKVEALELYSQFGKEAKCLGKCTVDIPYIADIAPAIEAAKGQVAERKEENAEREVLSHSHDGITSLFEVMETSRNLEVRGWRCVWRVRTALTKDSRQGRGHTYLSLFVKVPQVCGKKVKINIPKDYKGLFIGKQGTNIKSLEKELQCKLFLL